MELPGVPTAAVLDAVLRWMYLQEPPFDRGQSASPKELLPAALALKLDRLAEECDYELASSMPGRYISDADEKAAAITSTIELLAFADTHNRSRLARFAVWQLPGNCWRQLRAAPGFDALPGPLQRDALAVASQQPPLVRREIGHPADGLFVIHSVPAKAYKAAGGQLTAAEWEEMVEWEQLHLWQAQQAAAGSGAAAALRQQQLRGGPRGRAAGGAAGSAAGSGRPALPATYEVTAADIASSGIETPYPSLPWALCEEGFYEDRGAVFDALTRMAHPHLATAIHRQRDAALKFGDGEEEAEEEEEEEASERLCAAILQDAAAPESDERAAREAALVVAAERGDLRAAVMLKMGITVSGVLPGL
ncbi:putative rabankyrin-5-like [Chlorella sorokiniana]|uniref:Rabankyrin-5-like n=1 Tax=Chlorella sorokiniana TaxID=3076 RepID=A0A2P6TMQ0_CHLSO|nr:putative rabankyrin-5-like [Chlorella sorokiniana]|eukprot:PRW45606.1 putative rabankyrin-5-like [Chlorella sorokiniana]